MTQLNPADTPSHSTTIRRSVKHAPSVVRQGQGQTDIVQKAEGLGAVAR